MPRNGSGVYSLPSGNPVVTSTTIEASWANTTLSDIAVEITGSLPRNGAAPMTGALGMGNNKILNLVDGTAATDAVNKGQMDTAITAGAAAAAASVVAAHAGAADPHPNYALESALGTASTKNTGTASGNVPLVGTKSATEVLAGLVELATQAEAEAGSADNVVMTPLKTAQAIPAKLNASGSAPVYACRSWVNFNGTGTVAIRASGNVSSITDNGVGNYTVNFTTAMPDANYAAVGICGGGPLGSVVLGGQDNAANELVYAAGSLRILASDASDNLPQDPTFVNVAIFR